MQWLLTLKLKVVENEIYQYNLKHKNGIYFEKVQVT